MTNIRFDYQYRDAGGSKACNFVVFSNPDALLIENIYCRLRKALRETEFFIADQIRIPEVFLYRDGWSLDNELDHCFHHFDSIEDTEIQVSDQYGRSIADFLNEIEFQSRLGWRLFDPRKRFAA